jgi:hypothetical protein
MVHQSSNYHLQLEQVRAHQAELHGLRAAERPARQACAGRLLRLRLAELWGRLLTKRSTERPSDAAATQLEG